ncbi:MAG: fatty acid-binding protein DegV, partial [Nitrospirae bacterium]
AQVVHADAVESGMQLAELLKRHLEIDHVPVLQAGAVLGTHVGPGAVALAVSRE